MNKHALAELLDNVATFIDSLTSKEATDKIAARQARIDKYAAAYQARTGEALPADMREKLSSADEDVLDHLAKTANTTGGSPDSLGGPVEVNSLRKHAHDDPDAAFLARING